MIFLAFGFIFLSTLAALIWLFILDTTYGLAGLVVLLFISSLIILKVLRIKRVSKKRAMDEFYLHLKSIYGEERADKIHGELVYILGTKNQHLSNSILGVNAKFRLSSKSGTEELKMILDSLGISGVENENSN